MSIVLNGNTGIQNVLGSASSPADTNTTTPTTGVYYPSATTWGVSTAGTNALYIDASQNVGIGTSSPTSKLTVAGNLSIQDGAGFGWAGLSSYVGGSSASSFINFITASSERMRIDSSGNLLVGTTSAGSYGQKQIIVGGFGLTIAATFALTSSVQKIAAGVGLLCVIRDTTFGGVCIALYENTLTPVIVSQTNSGKFITSGTPTGQQILLGNANQSPLNVPGIQASTASGAGITVSVATISCQNI